MWLLSTHFVLKKVIVYIMCYQVSSARINKVYKESMYWL